ncbi:MAG: hypothetical protein VX563_05775, partial [Planctomycetota bacterium]|nr:hypothetical protein [Planctomycetota bacterium]
MNRRSRYHAEPGCSFQFSRVSRPSRTHSAPDSTGSSIRRHSVWSNERLATVSPDPVKYRLATTPGSTLVSTDTVHWPWGGRAAVIGWVARDVSSVERRRSALPDPVASIVALSPS